LQKNLKAFPYTGQSNEPLKIRERMNLTVQVDKQMRGKEESSTTKPIKFQE
jgi:hypothetical protein